ncbi:outer membrane protein assembly factor BamB [Agaribacter marinus]|uniref:Outer membrane protein assembly factor BamB n=1 Tax=Agaribacter marinus TaxID=1431249 RepID=A0AA37SZZ2_9ALTE|nr:outer membrane protein assembly factor BamB [Agaribacter marinus]GLR72958.1 outer membrane protein assembly factor BamB [Agaribacter marinus]
MKNKIYVLVGAAMMLGGCSTISGWFTDEEELEIRRLAEIDMVFTPQIEWQEEIGDGVDEYFSNLSPVAAYSKIFAADRAGSIYALSPDSGKVLWEQDISTDSKESKLSNLYGMFPARIPAKISGGLSAAYETIFLGTENGEVIALNEADGSIKWQVKVPGEVIVPPAIDAGVVVINTVAGVLLGLDADTGEVKWQNESDVPPLSLRGVSAPTAANGGAIVGTATGKLIVNIIDTGLTAWEQVIAKPVGATELERIVDVDSKPIVFGGNIYIVSYGGGLSAVELRTGQVVWNREYAAYQNVTVNGNTLYVTDNNSNIYAIDRRNGVELWSNTVLRKRGLTAATPIGEHVVVGDKWGFLHWLNQADGKIVSRLDLGGDDEDEGIYTAPIEANGKLLVKTREGDLNLISVP